MSVSSRGISPQKEVCPPRLGFMMEEAVSFPVL
jgi:hypothetical protein